MAYQKQNFTNGQVLQSSHLNKIEQGIVQLEQSVDDKADKSEIPTNVSQLTNDKGYLTSIPSEYITETELNNKGYLTGSNIKTINGNSILGSGNITIISGSGSSINYDLNVKTVNHRGWSKAPENTIPAYIESKANGYTYVECDVNFTKDSVAVLLHDDTIDRTSNGTGTVSEMTYQELLAYDFGSWKGSAYTGTKIAKFTEFLLTCKGLGLHPYIEIKRGNYTQEQILQIVNEVAVYGLKGKVTYISFNNTFLGYIKDYDSSARLGYVVDNLSDNIINQAKTLKTTDNEVFLDVNWNSFRTGSSSESLVSKCITENIPIEVWTVDNVISLNYLPDYVSGFTSNSLILGKVLYEKYSTYTPPSVSAVPTTSVTITPTTLTFDNLTPQQLTATVEPSNTTDVLTWESNNNNVATVTNGLVTPVTKGNCVITAKSGSYSATASVVVNYEVPTYTVTRNLVNATSSSNVVEIIEGRPHTETITVNDGCRWDSTITVTMGGTDISSKCVNGVLTIESVTGDIVITATAIEVPSYNVVRNLVGCTSSSATSKIIENNTHTETFTASNGYTLNGATITVTMGGTDISNKYSNGTLTIDSVTGDVVITVTAKAIPIYTITRNLTNCTSSNSTTSIMEGNAHTETFTANSRHTLEGATVVITMGGTDISNKYVNGVLTIESVTGNIVINITAIEIDMNIPSPIVDWSLTNITNGTIPNNGTGGATYNATVQNGNYTSNANGITLETTAYAETPYTAIATSDITLVVRCSLDEISTRQYERIFRTSTDALCLFYTTTQQVLQAKFTNLTGTTTGYKEGYTKGTKNVTFPKTFTHNELHTYAMVGDVNANLVSFYVDGELIITQEGYTSMATITGIGIGDNGKNNYYFNKATFTKFQIYNQALTGEQIATL